MWWWDSNQGPVGKVEFGLERGRPGSAVWVHLRLLLTLVAMVAASIALPLQLELPGFEPVLATLGGLVAYSFVGVMVRPQADLTNMGWMGGLVDNPFRYRDDLNRTLQFFDFVLWPGRVLGGAFVAFWRFHAGER
jgi:hypothetical protein